MAKKTVAEPIVEEAVNEEVASETVEETVAEEVVEKTAEEVAEPIVEEAKKTTEKSAPKKYIGGEQVANKIRYVSSGMFRCPECGNAFNAKLSDVESGKVKNCGCVK